MRIFLSYPRKNTDKARQLKDVLFKGGHSVWMDDQLMTGQPWRGQLEAQIKQADGIALALTPNWVASPYCQWEFTTAVENGKKIVPVLLEKASLPDRISQYQYADFTDGFADDTRVQKFLDDLLELAVIVDSSAIAGVDKEVYAIKIDQENRGGGDNINVSGTGNTVAGENVNQSRQNIHVGGSISGAIVNVGGNQAFHGDIKIEYSALAAAPTGSPLNELKALLQELETALKQVPVGHADDIELVQEYANEIAEEATKQVPRKKKLEITGENLKKATENLAAVAPIAVQIAKTLLMIG